MNFKAVNFLSCICLSLSFLFSPYLFFLSIQESLGAERVSESVLSFVEMLLPVVLGLLKGPVQEQGDAHLRKHFQRVTHISTLLLNILTSYTQRVFISTFQLT